MISLVCCLCTLLSPFQATSSSPIVHLEALSSYLQARGLKSYLSPSLNRLSISTDRSLKSEKWLEKVLVFSNMNGNAERTNSDKLRARQLRQAGLELKVDKFFKSRRFSEECHPLSFQAEKNGYLHIFTTHGLPQIIKANSAKSRNPFDFDPVKRLCALAVKSLGAHNLATLPLGYLATYSSNPTGNEAPISDLAGVNYAAFLGDEYQWISFVSTSRLGYRSDLLGKSARDTSVVVTNVAGKPSVACSVFDQAGQLIDEESISPFIEPSIAVPQRLIDKKYVIPDTQEQIDHYSFNPYFGANSQKYKSESTHLRSIVSGIFFSATSSDPLGPFLNSILSDIAKNLGDTQVRCILGDNALQPLLDPRVYLLHNIRLDWYYKLLSKNYLITSTNGTLTIRPRLNRLCRLSCVPRKSIAAIATCLKNPEITNYSKFLPAMGALTGPQIRGALVTAEVRLLDNTASIKMMHIVKGARGWSNRGYPYVTLALFAHILRAGKANGTTRNQQFSL